MIFAPPPNLIPKIIFLKDKRARAIFPSAFGFIAPLFVCLILKARPTLFFRAGSLIVKAQLLSINKGWYVFPHLESAAFDFHVIMPLIKKALLKGRAFTYRENTPFKGKSAPILSIEILSSRRLFYQRPYRL